MAASNLLHLASLIQNAAQLIDNRCKDTATDFPDVYKPLNSEAEVIRKDPAVAAASTKIVAAAYQLISTVQPPAKSLFNVATSVCRLISQQYMNSNLL